MMHLLLCRHVLSIGLGFASSVMPVVGRGVRVVVGPAGCSAQLGERRGRVAVVEKLRDPDSSAGAGDGCLSVPEVAVEALRLR